MFRYAFEYLSESEFEDLIVAICHNVLGISAHAFASGRDGGRDSYFSGIAANYPNERHPWSGNFIIQAKHVKDPNESCSDGAFFPNSSGIIVKEVAKIKKTQTNRTDRLLYNFYQSQAYRRSASSDRSIYDKRTRNK